MEVKKIQFVDILMDKPKPEDRTISNEFCENLAKSIEAQGLLYEPYVRPVQDKPGKYRVIAGRHRMIACKKYLKWTEITSKVVPESMTDDEVRAIELADNLWRNNLDDGQLKKALAEWHAIYLKSHPLEGKGSSAKAEKEVKKKLAEAEAKGELVNREDVVAKVAAEAKPFSKVLQETLKVSPATAGRLARVAKNLDPTQIDVLEKHDVTNDIYDKLAGLGSKDLIDKAIALIASGMDHAEAVRQAAKAKPTPTPEQKRVAANASKAAKAPPKPKEADLTDDDWLAENCELVLKNLKRKGPYKRDAILYRRIAKTLVSARGSLKKPLAEAKHADGNGSWWAVVNKFVKTAHPRQWLVCGACEGTGSKMAEPGSEAKTKQKCDKCYGSAYIIKLED